MKRTSPFFTLPGIVLTILFLVGLAVFSWVKGGQAFSPGRLSAQGQAGALRNGYGSHLEFEKQCKLCHAPLKGDQSGLCLDCHTEVDEQIQNKQGTHGVIEATNPCFRCHTEHKGQDYNILQPGLALFDHEQTGFSLNWHQLDYGAAPLPCSGCHSLEQGFALDQGQAASSATQPKTRRLCSSIPASSVMTAWPVTTGPTGWRTSNIPRQLFRWRASTLRRLAPIAIQSKAPPHPGWIAFPRQSAECTSCHETGHPGLFEEPCEKCHNSNAWSPADWNGRPFEHAASGFSLAKHELDAQGGALACTDCHGADVNQDVLPACRDCHAQGADGAAFIANHEEQFGPACMDCHDGVDRMSNFDHASFFVLDGRHADLECQECHARPGV